MSEASKMRAWAKAIQMAHGRMLSFRFVEDYRMWIIRCKDDVPYAESVWIRGR